MGAVRAVLRSVWDEPRAPGAPARTWLDWVLVVLVPPATLIEGLLRIDLTMRWVQVGLTLALVPTLLWRRTRPLLMVAIAFGVCGLSPLLLGRDLELNALVFLSLLPYALFRWGSARESVVGALIVATKLAASGIAGYLEPADVVAGVVVLSLVCSLGAAVRYRANGRLRELDQVKLLERERLARDLHDTVAHHVSAMAIRAQAGLATMATRPEAAAEALRVIEAEASRALAEMRTMVHALRSPGSPGQGPDAAAFTPAQRIRDLARLDATGSRPAVRVELTGDVDELPGAVQSAVFRLAQESVTNARRHARNPSRITVRVAADEAAVRLEVTDDGEVQAPATEGFGLVGMAERASLLGGRFQAGPRQDRGWSVTAVLPRARAS